MKLLRGSGAAWAALLTLGAGMAAARPAAALDFTFTFNGVAPGTLVNSLVPANVNVGFFPARQAVNDNGDFFNPARYEADPTSPGVTVRAALRSPGNALDAELGPVLFQLGTGPGGFPTGMDTFSFFLDGYTNPLFLGPLPVLFYDANDVERARILLGRDANNNGVADEVGTTLSANLSGLNVQKVVLPGGAFYDNVRFVAPQAAIPEASTLGLLAGAAAVAGVNRLRPRRRRGESHHARS